MSVDQELKCKDCQMAFIFTAGEQDFFAGKGLNPPVRCKPCRAKKKAEREGAGAGGGSPSPSFGSRPIVMEAAPPSRRGGGGGGGGGRRHGGGGGRRRDRDAYDD